MHSSGDLLADLRYRYAEAAFAEEDYGAAADLARQTLELAPNFAAAWFLLGQAEAWRGASEEAIAAFRQAVALDPQDSLGAGLRLAALGAVAPAQAMAPAYIRALFDEYAPRFDRHLVRSLGYRAPELLRDAVRRACSRRLREARFARMLDLGCGTGLAGRAFADLCETMVGIDLSPAMLAKARATKLYAELDSGDLLDWLRRRPESSADLVIAADVFVYIAELAPVFAEAHRLLDRGGMFAFTVQAHGGDGFVLGGDLRYAHAEPYLRRLATEAGLEPVLFERVSTRQDRGRDVPGLLVVLAH